MLRLSKRKKLGFHYDIIVVVVVVVVVVVDDVDIDVVVVVDVVGDVVITVSRMFSAVET